MADGASGRLAVRQLLELIGNKWAPVVLYELGSEDQRFGELHRGIGGVSKKVLTQTLRRLEAAGLVRRTVEELVPPHTRYGLTESGLRVREPVELLCDWAKANAGLLAEIEGRDRGQGA